MDRARLIAMPDFRGFTLVESLVALAIFSIAFSGIYFFFSVSQQSIYQSEKRLFINLMANRIVSTIANQAQLSATDTKNPFLNPTIYAGSLSNCATYPSNDIRYSWCSDLSSSIGAFNSSSGKELRQIDITNDGTGLIINVSIITDNGNVSSYFTRKIRQR